MLAWLHSPRSPSLSVPGRNSPAAQGLLSPVQDGLLLLLLGAGAAQDAFPGLGVLGLALCQRFDGEGGAAGGVGVAEDAVGRGPLEDADLGRRPRGKAVVLDHDRHFGRRFGLSAVGKKKHGVGACFPQGFSAWCVNSSCSDGVPVIQNSLE